jgi:hypothetical protein
VDAALVTEMMYNRTNVGIGNLWGPDVCPPPEQQEYCYCRPNPKQPPPARGPINVWDCIPWTKHPFPFGSEFYWDTTGVSFTRIPQVCQILGQHKL